MFICPECLGPATAGQTINKLENTGQVIYRFRYCKRCDIRIKTKEEIVETIYYVRRKKKNEEEAED